MPKSGVRKIEKQDDAPVPVADGAAEYKLQVNGKSVSVQIDGNIATVNGTAYTVDIEDAVSTQETAPTDAEPVSAQMPGKVHSNFETHRGSRPSGRSDPHPGSHENGSPDQTLQMRAQSSKCPSKSAIKYPMDRPLRWWDKKKCEV